MVQVLLLDLVPGHDRVAVAAQVAHNMAQGAQIEAKDAGHRTRWQAGAGPGRVVDSDQAARGIEERIDIPEDHGVQVNEQAATLQSMEIFRE